MEDPNLTNHINGSWNSVHGIWANIRPKIPYFMETTSVSYVPTWDDGWHDVTVAGAPSNSVVIAVLSILWEGDADADTFYFYTRKNGSSADWEGIATGAGRHSSMILQLCDDDGKYEYRINGASAHDLHVKQVGYMVFPK